MPNAPGSFVLRYGCAAVSIALATWGRLLLDPALGNEFPYATLFFAVLLTAWYGGFGPALVAVVLGAFSSDYFLLPPRGSFVLAGRDQYVGMALYLCTSLGIAVLAGAMHAAWRRAEASGQATQRQAALIDQTYDAVLAWDWNGPITFWNRGAERLYGFPRAEALGRVSHELFRTQRPGGVRSCVRSLEREGTWEGEVLHTTRDGQKITVESRMVLVREAEGAYVLEANRDITQRQRAEAALREVNEQLESRVQERTAELARTNESLRISEERFRLLVAGVQDYAILMLDPDGRVISWNAGAERIKGYRAEEIVGQHFSRFYAREDVDGGKPEQELKMAATAGRFQDEGWRLRKDGSRFWANVLITAIHGETGELRGFSKVTRDMTQRRREEAALQESQARVGGIVDAAMDAIISVNDEERIVLFNGAAERMFRCPAATAMGQSIGMFIPARFREQHRQHVRRFGKTGVTGRSMGALGAFSGLRADGEEFPIEASISQIEVAGHKLHTVILRDITEHVRAGEEIRKLNAELEQRVVERTAELEASNKELEAFSYTVSHDLRAPLRGVDGFSQAVLEDFGTQLPEEGRRYLQTIRAGAQRMGELIDGLLTFSRLSRLPLNRRTVNTGKLVSNALEELGFERQGRAVEVHVGDLPPCEGDPTLLKQVWTNLLSNALKYTRQRAPAVVEIGCQRDNGTPVYFVRDNGTGFDMQYANELFGVFQRLHRAEDFEGTGVGLAIVQRIVHRHGGRVWAEAEEERGATFYFTVDGGTKS